MRFLLVILIWIIFIAGFWGYTARRDAALPKGPARVAAPKALGQNFVLEITPTFDIEKDPFALTLDDDASQAPGLEILVNGRELKVEKGPIKRGKVIRVKENLVLFQGVNEFYVKASPPMAQTGLDHGVRVRLLERGVPVADRTVWATSGAVVAGTVSFTLAAPKKDVHDE